MDFCDSLHDKCELPISQWGSSSCLFQSWHVLAISEPNVQYSFDFFLANLIISYSYNTCSQLLYMDIAGILSCLNLPLFLAASSTLPWNMLYILGTGWRPFSLYLCFSLFKSLWHWCLWENLFGFLTWPSMDAVGPFRQGLHI